jgi:di/tricarboxylate transporter
LPFIVAVTVAASCGFATPLGYQTHLIVYGPGGYRFTDFLRIGVPMNLIVMAVALTVIPRVWPLVPTP